MYKYNEEYSKILNDESNRYEYRIGYILVVEDSYKKFYSVYLCPSLGEKRFLTSREKLRPALKVAKLLNSVYNSGFEEAKSLYDEDYFRK